MHPRTFRQTLRSQSNRQGKLDQAQPSSSHIQRKGNPAPSERHQFSGKPQSQLPGQPKYLHSDGARRGA